MLPENVQGRDGLVKIYYDKLCPLELRRETIEVMCQVHWEIVEGHGACYCSCVAYRRLVRRMLLNRASKLKTERDEKSDSDVEEEVRGSDVAGEKET
jgi:hypothetical protein